VEQIINQTEQIIEEIYNISLGWDELKDIGQQYLADVSPSREPIQSINE
jgi:hypothetical protein